MNNMKRRNHQVITLISFVSLWILSFFYEIFEQITITSIILPIVWAVVPDMDKRDAKSHRNMWWHSILIPLFVYIFNPHIVFLLTTLSAGLHCLCDIRFKKIGGFYTVKYYKMKSIGGYRFATVWYLINFVSALIIFIIALTL